MAKAAPDIEGEAGGHTPTPWRVYKTTNGRLLLGIGDADAGGITDAEFGLWRSEPERSANAAFIVKAVNSHDDRALLIRAFCNFQVRWEPWDAERGEACVNGICFATRLDTDGVPIVTDALRAALASAEAGDE
jgi:hypothetical protein